MTSFENEFFQDLCMDFMTNEEKSILFEYFRKERERILMVVLKKCRYEEICSMKETVTFENIRRIMDEDIKYHRIAKNIDKKNRDKKNPNVTKIEFINDVLEEINIDTKTVDKKRKNKDEMPVTKIPCDFYDYAMKCKNGKLKKQELELETNAFISELKDAILTLKKTTKQRIEKAMMVVNHLENTDSVDVMYNAMNQVLDLYTLEECNQFIYDSGYSVKKVDNIIEYPASRIKTIKTSLLNFYFEKKKLSLSGTPGIGAKNVNKKAIDVDEDARDKMEELYKFVCSQKLSTTVIPLMIDNDSGSGLYILGSSYLDSWYDLGGDYGERVKDIIGTKSCCYAIVKFFNLDLVDKDKDIFYWSPYSLVDAGNIKNNKYNDLNPEKVIFTDLNRAIDMYQGQLNVTSNAILYENFRATNFLDQVTEIEMEPEYAKYFSCEGYNSDDLEKIVNEFKVETENISVVKKEEAQKKKNQMSN